MDRKLTIVVTCTDRKSAPPGPLLMARALPEGSIHARAETWRERLWRTTYVRRPLRHLYQGETWTQALRLERTAVERGFRPHLVVASAGLGLCAADAVAPSYSATFTTGQADSVGESTHDNRRWWRAICRGAEESVASDGPTIMVLSKSYADAIADDLVGLRDREDVVVFGGSSALPSSLRIASDRDLRGALGGTATSLNVRMAASWLERMPGPEFDRRKADEAWELWASDVRRREVYARQPVTDQEVVHFVCQLRDADPTVSKSRALRALRDSNRACEQARFGQLFAKATAAS